MRNQLGFSFGALILGTLFIVAPIDRYAIAVDVADVRAAWSSYWSNVDVFQYQFELTRLPLENKTISLRTSAIFSHSGRRIAYQTEGEEWDGVKIAKRTKNYVFDGSSSNTWVAGAPVTIGEIHVGKATKHLTMYAEHYPLWLAYRPLDLLQRLGYATDQMRFGQLDAERDGIKCIEVQLDLPHYPIRRSSVYVDPSRRYLPVRFDWQDRNVVREELSIKYTPNSTVGWVVSDWDDETFNGSGELLTSISGRITKFSINEPLAETVFNSEFPVGTHVVRCDGDSRECFIQLANGTRKPISMDEYGVVAKESTPVLQRSTSTGRWILLICSAVFLIVLLATLIRYHKKNS